MLSTDRPSPWPHRALALLLVSPLLLGFWGADAFQKNGGLTAFERAFGSTEQIRTVFQAFSNSGWIGLGAALVATGLGLGAGWALSRRPRSILWLALCALPLAIAPSVMVSGWLTFLAPGNASDISSAFRLSPPGVAGPGPLFSIPGAALLLGLNLWPIIALETWPAFTRARGDSYSAALMHGTPIRAFIKIAMPMARGEIMAGFLLVFLLAATDFTTSSLLLVRTLPIEINDQLTLNRPAAGAWMSLPLVLFVALLAWILSTLKREAWTANAGASENAAPSNVSPHKWGWGESLLALGWFMGFVVPLLGCVWPVLSSGQSFHRTFGPGINALGDSLRLATAAALFVWAITAARVGFWPQVRTSWLNLAGLFLLSVPGTFLAGGLLTAMAWDHAGGAWIPGIAWLALGYALRFLYLPLRLADEGLRTLDPAVFEAAALAGHSKLSQGVNIALPLVSRYCFAGAALAWVLALGELPISERLHPPGVTPASVWLFDQQHYGYTEDVFALSLLAGITAALLLTTTAWILNRTRRA